MWMMSRINARRYVPYARPSILETWTQSDDGRRVDPLSQDLSPDGADRLDSCMRRRHATR